jgi:hypothetical protein
MKPKPFWSLNHLTVPVAITVTSGNIERVYMQAIVRYLRKDLLRTADRGTTETLQEQTATSEEYRMFAY